MFVRVAVRSKDACESLLMRAICYFNTLKRNFFKIVLSTNGVRRNNMHDVIILNCFLLLFDF
jgi:hypothetical protein